MNESEPTIGDARVRFILATTAIRTNNTVARLHTDEEILADHGYRSTAEYWEAALSETMPATKFVDLLETHLTTPPRLALEIEGKTPRLGMLIAATIRQAAMSCESWLKRSAALPSIEGVTDLEQYHLDPRDAALWLLKRPMDRDKLPLSLQAYLGTSKLHRDSSMPPNPAGRPSLKEKVHELLDELNLKGTMPSGPKEIERLLHGKGTKVTCRTVQRHINTWHPKRHK
ncbi:MAG TPA: hypothetical protein VKZ79_00575 [Alphaproteobacteria bacterium]|nr:hypothetical protein [Alphaproteobacteria bacterium]